MCLELVVLKNKIGLISRHNEVGYSELGSYLIYPLWTGIGNETSFVFQKLSLGHMAADQVVALVEKEIRVYKPEECPYCAVGSPRYRPKTHWAELTGRK